MYDKLMGLIGTAQRVQGGWSHSALDVTSLKYVSEHWCNPRTGLRPSVCDLHRTNVSGTFNITFLVISPQSGTCTRHTTISEERIGTFTISSPSCTSGRRRETQSSRHETKHDLSDPSRWASLVVRGLMPTGSRLSKGSPPGRTN